MTRKRQPGLPSAAEVRAHAERWPINGGGLWRANAALCVPMSFILYVVDGHVFGFDRPRTDLGNMTWHPCTPDGRDVADVEALAKFRQDLDDASGELLIPIPEPGTDMCKMMTANRLIRRERDDALADARRLYSSGERLLAERDEARAQLAEAQAAVERLRIMAGYEDERRDNGTITALRNLAELERDIERWRSEQRMRIEAEGRIPSSPEATAARMPWPPPADRVGALHDRVHIDPPLKVRALVPAGRLALRTMSAAGKARIAGLERDLSAERTRYAELLERWRSEQRRRIAAEDAQKYRGMLVELILAGEPAATAAFRAAAETLEAHLALRTLGANLAMAGLCAHFVYQNYIESQQVDLDDQRRSDGYTMGVLCYKGDPAEIRFSELRALPEPADDP